MGLSSERLQWYNTFYTLYHYYKIIKQYYLIKNVLNYLTYIFLLYILVDWNIVMSFKLLFEYPVQNEYVS